MEINLTPKGEKPLDNLVSDGGYAAIFRTICCIGDSLASGEFEALHDDGSSTYHDMYEYSWGQFLARMCGSKAYNFSRGGMTAKEFCESFAEANGFWNAKYASQAYIIALGVNDLDGGQEIGSVSDVDINDYHRNTRNFAGYFGEIIQRMKLIQPRAKFFLVTRPRQCNDAVAAIKENHRRLMYEFAELFDNTYVIDLLRYAPVYDEEFIKTFHSGGHLNPMGYLFTAKMFASYMDYIIRHNMKDFKDVGFIGTELKSRDF